MRDFHLDILRVLYHPGAQYSSPRLDHLLITSPHLYGRADGWEPEAVALGLMPALRELERGELVKAEEHRTDRSRYALYSITDAGRRAVEATVATATSA